MFSKKQIEYSRVPAEDRRKPNCRTYSLRSDFHQYKGVRDPRYIEGADLGAQRLGDDEQLRLRATAGRTRAQALGS